MSQMGRNAPSSGAAPIETLTGNVGGAVGPTDFNVNVVGSGLVTTSGNPGSSTVTIELTDNVPSSFSGNTGIAFPSANNLNIVGVAPVVTSGATDTISIEVDGTVATLYDCDTNSATPAGNILNVVGGLNVTTTGIGSTINISANTGKQIVNYTLVDSTQSPYVVLDADYYMGTNVNGGVLSIHLPNSTDLGRIFVVKDSVGNAAINNITVTTVGGVVTIDGGTTYAINADFEAVSLLWNGVEYEVYSQAKV